MIELDVLRDREGRLIIAHDYKDALSRRPLDLTEALDAFLEPPLDEVEIDCDLKLPGREAELAGALAGRGLVERAMVSTMEVESLRKLRQLEPDLRLGWTYPKTRRDWTQYGWAVPGVAAGLAAMRRRFPKTLAQTAPELDVDAVWAYHQIVTPKLVEAAEEAGVELIAWTVDERRPNGRADRDGRARHLLERPAPVRRGREDASRARRLSPVARETRTAAKKAAKAEQEGQPRQRRQEAKAEDRRPRPRRAA